MSVQVWEGDGLAARPTDTAVQCVFDDDGVDDLVGSCAVEADNVRSELGVLATGPASAEATRAEGGLLTGPAVQARHLPTGVEASGGRVPRDRGQGRGMNDRQGETEGRTSRERRSAVVRICSWVWGRSSMR